MCYYVYMQDQNHQFYHPFRSRVALSLVDSLGCSIHQSYEQFIAFNPSCLHIQVCQNILQEFDSINDLNADHYFGGKSTLRSPCTKMYNDCFSDHTYLRMQQIYCT